MKQYKLLNNVLGWVVFVISAVTYILTLEPTASFWDCGEFISSAYKLEVGHPPGNPIFMLTGRFFANFASDPTQVAYMINLMSGLLSAGTILLLFWTITHLARKIVVKEGEEMSMGQMIAILGSGLVGSLAYAFSDTFWFSAVE
ncbi:glycosyltransferase family 117 protein, partial [Coprobacter fastidiosus]